MSYVKQIVTGVIEENCYLIYNDEHLLIVDPGDEFNLIKQAVADTGKKPVAILLTHTHHDHIGALEEARNTYDIPVYVSPYEQDWLQNPELNLSIYGPKQIICQPAEYEFELKSYTLGGMTFRVVATPGHSPGGVSFIFDEFVITGDALFAGSIGRTDLPFGDTQTLLNSVRTQLLTLPEEMIAYPGHRNPTTIGKEKRTNPFFN